ncbi:MULTISPECIES: CHAT domain-containing protein [unclassified Nocardioides]|uniref:CHAT domain-containing protein n=1 Tax=unclassified Nocardioides TaxID=2615069 RepID=UPI0036158D30
MIEDVPDYDELHLRIERDTDGSYRVLASTPSGRVGRGHFRSPLTDDELDDFVESVGQVRRSRGPQDERVDEIKTLGTGLFDALMQDHVAAVYNAARAAAEEKQRGLRIAISLSGAPELTRLPWEYLYSRPSFLSESIYTPLVRALDLESARWPLKVEFPLKVLGMVSSPAGYPELNSAEERRKLEEALVDLTADGRVSLEWLETGTLAELSARVSKRDPIHVLHYIGHGAYDEATEHGILVLESPRGRRADDVPGEKLGRMLQDEKSLRLVVLNSCEGARASRFDPFSGVAGSLIEFKIPAVIAMQFEVTDEAAIAFSGSLYTQLAQGLPIDAAVAPARRAIVSAQKESEFGTPVLFLRSGDTRLFDLDPTVPPPTPPPLPTPPPEPKPEPPPKPPPPPLLLRLLQWFVAGFRAHARPIAIALALVIVAGGVAFAISQIRGDGPGPPEAEGDTAGPWPLSDSQLLIAAGPDRSSQDIWLVDTDDASLNRRLTDSDLKEWLPALGPDRDQMIFSRAKSVSADLYELRTTGAGDDGGDRPLFDTTPEQCQQSTSRPAWSADGTRLVVRCLGSNDAINVVLLDETGTALQTFDPPAESALLSLNDPTYSRDGRTIVLWGSTESDVQGGSLWAIDVDTGAWRLLLRAEFPGQYSDPVVSPDGTMIAFRKDLDEGDNRDFEIFTAPFSSSQESIPVDSVEQLTDLDGLDEDPTFSPQDGSRIAFAHVADDGSRIWVVDADGSGAPEPLLPEPIGDVETVPAWSRR